MYGPWLDQQQSDLLTGFYFDRREIGSRVSAAIDRKQHILLYGLPRQGKSTLLSHVLRETDYILVHASRDSAFADLSRAILLSLGCSVTAEQKTRKKFGTKAEVGFKWPFFSAGGSVDAGAEQERTVRNFTAEIGNPNDVYYLLKQFADLPILVVDWFDHLDEREQNLMLDLVRISAENRKPQIVLVASSLQNPLSRRQRLTVARQLTVIDLPPLTIDETNAMIAAALAYAKSGSNCEVPPRLYELSGGSLELTLSLCDGIIQNNRASGGNGETGADFLIDQISSGARDCLLAFLTAIFEEGWSLRCHYLVTAEPGAGSAAAADASAAGTVEAAKEQDDVYQQARYVLMGLVEPLAADGLDERTRKAVVALQRSAKTLGSNIARCAVQSERMRQLLFAVCEFLRSPLGQSPPARYIPRHDDEVYRLRYGMLFCDLLLQSDLTKAVTVTPAVIDQYCRAKGLTVRRDPSRGTGRFKRMANRLNKLQRSMRISPPLFGINAEGSEITIWSADSWRLFGDVKPELRKLLEEFGDEDDNDDD